MRTGIVMAWMAAMAAWPAARNPSTRVSGISATISITGGMYLCADSTKKYFTSDGSGLVEREQDGVTIISRDAAE